MKHPSGIEAYQLAEYMGYHLGSAFVALWEGRLEAALDHLKLSDKQTAPLPGVQGHLFRLHTERFRVIFNRPSPWCEAVRFAMAAICNMCASEHFGEQARISVQAILSVETAIADEKCVGRGQEP